jgi:hypothetical protein
MFVSIATVALALQVGVPALSPSESEPLVQQIQYGGGSRGGRYPVRCGHGADVDARDGLCYPTGTVPRRFQQGRRYQRPQYDEDYYERRPRRRYYY